MAKTLSRALMGAWMIFCALFAGAAPAAAESRIAFTFQREARIHVAGSVAGSAADMVLDTGASVHVIDAAFARRLGLTKGVAARAEAIGGGLEGQLFDHVAIRVGDLTLADQRVLAVDLSGLSRSNGRAIDLILGRPFFEATRVSIDFPARTLTLDAPVPAAAPVALRRAGEHSLVLVRAAGLPAIPAVLDLGNPGAISISAELADKLPSLGQRAQGLAIVAGLGGATVARRVTLGDVAIGGARVADVPAEIGEARGTPFAGRANVGIAMFASGKLTLDMAGQRLWIESGAAPARIARDRTGLSLVASSRGARIAMVSPGSPAAASGLTANEEIVALDGQPLTATLLASAWNRGDAGRTVHLTRADGKRVALTLADYY